MRKDSLTKCNLFMQSDGTGELQSVFAILLQAELVPATVNDYREKLLHLRKLRCDIVQSTIPTGPLQEVSPRQQEAVTYPYSKRLFLFHHIDCRVFNESSAPIACGTVFASIFSKTMVVSR